MSITKLSIEKKKIRRIDDGNNVVMGIRMRMRMISFSMITKGNVS